MIVSLPGFPWRRVCRRWLPEIIPHICNRWRRRSWWATKWCAIWWSIGASAKRLFRIDRHAALGIHLAAQRRYILNSFHTCYGIDDGPPAAYSCALLGWEKHLARARLSSHRKQNYRTPRVAGRADDVHDHGVRGGRESADFGGG